ncbi:efflux RND transporter periplasmic adaptor subunit [Actinomadura barringtoniae]|uniref:Efflux RND transporter periplasmic adaptor subunit n=1 Tax=Actinomadura barringtoniae TaxID=1427535 RepID=A0A939P664_9ACTN|nr:efflux RND transporter periplasmic adaptor subunit [Actinomadura barringtoniae]MBO2446030.1 efflux RND transporter periplasmic adaptor subunit [Actinomadura barringtoniae]
MIAGVGVLVLLAAAGVVVAVVDPFGDDDVRPAASADGTSLVAVREGPLSTQVTQSGTLSFAAQGDGTPYAVINQAKGIYTWVPGEGKEIGCGKTLYRVDEKPVVLICGRTPAYRTLQEGDKGREVRDLNKNLVRLGYAEKSELDPDSYYYGWATAAAVTELQDDLGVDQTGQLKLGDAVFLPGPLRVTKTIAKDGTRAAAGAQMAQTTTATRQVMVELDPGQQTQVKTGDRAQITLPDNTTTPGKVSRIGTVARSGSGSGSGSDKSSDKDSSNSTIPVYITLKRPKDAGKLDEAPVQVQITTAGVEKALIVPVTALMGRAGGGYVVEVAGAAGRPHRLVPVTLGMFDNDNGLVQVSGGLSTGDQVVVPAS